MNTQKLITIIFVVGSLMAVTGTSSANTTSFSDEVNFDHDHVVYVPFVYNCPASLTYTFLADTVSLPQCDLGILNSVELTVESTIDVDTYYYYIWDTHHATMYWYSNVIGSVNGLKAKIYQAHNYVHIGHGMYHHTFTIDGSEPNSISTNMAGFVGTGTVDVVITGDDKLCTWWNPYDHYDTDTYGVVNAILTYDYTPLTIEIKPETLNLKSKGVFTAFIELPEGYDEEDVDLDTVECEGAPALEATMADDKKLILKFDREDLAGVSAGNSVELTVKGELTDGTSFAVSDTIRVID